MNISGINYLGKCLDNLSKQELSPEFRNILNSTKLIVDKILKKTRYRVPLIGKKFFSRSYYLRELKSSLGILLNRINEIDLDTTDLLDAISLLLKTTESKKLLKKNLANFAFKQI